MEEADILINNTNLNKAEAMTLRVAVNSFLMHLDSEGLGDDRVGIDICEGYKICCRSVLSKMKTK